MEKKKKSGTYRLIVALLILFLVFYFAKTGMKIFKLQAEKSQVEAQNEKLLEEKEKLAEELDNVNSKEFIEKMARKDLKLIKNNELLFVLPEFVKDTDGDVEEAEDGSDEGKSDGTSEN